MKKFILSLGFAALTATPMLASTTYFKPGMTWVEEAVSNVMPWDTAYESILSLKPGGEEGVLELYSINETDADPVLTAYVKNEGEKVYVRSAQYGDTQNWYLMYDFGLKPGESCDVFYPYWKTEDGIPWKYSVTCSAILENQSEYYGLDLMVIDEDVVENFTTKGYWIKGIGGTKGVLENCRFGTEGGGRQLYQAIYNGETLYTSPTWQSSYFIPGAKWLTEYTNTTNPKPDYSYQEVILTKNGDEWLLESRNVNSLTEGMKVVAVVRTEGNKVFFRLPSDNGDNWYLMYDFGLKVGDGNYFYNPEWLTSEGMPTTSYLVCTEKTRWNKKYNMWDTMTLQEYDDENLNLHYGSGTWIRGLGSVNGFFENIGFERDGRGGTLIEASVDGDVIYSANGTNTVNTVGATNCNISVSGNTINISEAGNASSGAVYTIDSKLVSRFNITSGNACIAVTGPGLYILRIGSLSYKILIR